MGYGTGLRQLLDLLLFGKKFYEEIDWKQVEEIIGSLAADKFYADLLAIGATFLDIHIKSGFSGVGYKPLLEDIMQAGVFGKATAERRIGGKLTVAAIKHGSLHYTDLLFPKKTELMKKYRLSHIRSYQLLALWIKRFFRFIRFDLNLLLIGKSIMVGKRRMKLLRNYGIIE